MAILFSCWSIVESVLIGDGLQKWYCLRYFIHPAGIVFLQFFLFGKLFAFSMFIVLRYPGKIIWLSVLGSSRIVKYTVFKLVLIMELDDASITRLYGPRAPRERRHEFHETEEDEEDPFQSIVLYNSRRVFPAKNMTKTVFEYQNDSFFKEEREAEGGHRVEEELQIKAALQKDEEEKGEKHEEIGEKEEGEEENREEDGHEEEREDREAEAEKLISYVEEGEETDDSSLLGHSTEMIRWNRRHEIAEEVDEFYREYTKRMQWFDRLNSERIYALSSILNIDMGDPRVLENIEFHVASLADVYSKEFIRSIESDFEMVYVGQSCLSWEALHHHYRKVEALASSPTTLSGAFYGDVADKIQQFQVRVERFTENRIQEGKRLWNYIQKRFCTGNLLQVPNVSGYMDEADDDRNEEAMTAKRLLGIIQKAVRAFSEFLETDDSKPPGKLKKLLFVDPQVEDPNDLGLLDNLTKEASKKETKLKEIQKNKGPFWKKKRSPLGEVQTNEVFFSMIDIKLVSRVLKMSVISTQQLKWCEEKLNSIQIKKGELTRSSNGSLFPHS